MKVIFNSILAIAALLSLTFSSYKKKDLVSVIYYVDQSGGSDAAAGTSTGTAWKTIAKVNASTFAATDVILFKAGETWNEKLTVNRSDISFGRYGTGANPILTGLKALTGWTSIGGSKYTATATNSVPIQNLITINGVMKVKARYPNSYYLNSDGAGGDQTVIWGPNGIPDFTGAEIVLRSAHWLLNWAKVTSQVLDTIHFSPHTQYLMASYFLGTNGYFVQNLPSLCDTIGEWSYDSTSKLVTLYSSGSPTNVKYSNIDTLVDVTAQTNISFDGIDFTGANETGIFLWSSRNITIANCNFTQIGGRGVRSAATPHTTITNCTFNGIYNIGLDMEEGASSGGSDSSLISGNTFKNIGLWPGMVRSERTTYEAAIIKFGRGVHFTKNRIDSIGYCGLIITNINALVDSNYITNFCLTKDDGGGIYTVMSGFPLGSGNGMKFKHNVIGKGIGLAVTPAMGVYTSGVASAGIYLDNVTVGVTVDGNFLFDCNEQTIEHGFGHSDTIINNTIANGLGSGLSVYGDSAAVYDMYVKNNIFLNYNSHPNVRRSLYGGNMQNMDSNYYLQPKSASPSKPFYRASSIDSIRGVGLTFYEWVAATGQDSHSSLIPSTVVGGDPFLVHYNPTFSDSTISLSGNWVDIRGNVYNGAIILHPFTSAVLFKHYTRSIQSLKY